MVSWNIWNSPLQTNDHEPIRFWGGYNELIQNKPNRDLIYMKWIIIKPKYEDVNWCVLDLMMTMHETKLPPLPISLHTESGHMKCSPAEITFSVLFGPVRKLFTSLGATERYSPARDPLWIRIASQPILSFICEHQVADWVCQEPDCLQRYSVV